jgi:putative transposase
MTKGGVSFVRVSRHTFRFRAPVVAVGDRALGFWAAVGAVWAEIREQRCWVHRLADVLDKRPKRLQPKAKQALHAIMNAPTRAEAEAGIAAFAAEYDAKYPRPWRRCNATRRSC